MRHINLCFASLFT